MQPSIHFYIVFSYIHCHKIEEVRHQIFSSSILLKVFFRSPWLFFSTETSSSSLKCQCLISRWLSVIFDWLIGDFRRSSKQTLEMLFPLLTSFFLAGSY